MVKLQERYLYYYRLSWRHIYPHVLLFLYTKYYVNLRQTEFVFGIFLGLFYCDPCHLYCITPRDARALIEIHIMLYRFIDVNY